MICEVFWHLVHSREQSAHLVLSFRNISFFNGGICSGTQQSVWYPVGAGDTQKERVASARVAVAPKAVMIPNTAEQPLEETAAVLANGSSSERN